MHLSKGFIESERQLLPLGIVPIPSGVCHRGPDANTTDDDFDLDDEEHDVGNDVMANIGRALVAVHI